MKGSSTNGCSMSLPVADESSDMIEDIPKYIRRFDLKTIH